MFSKLRRSARRDSWTSESRSPAALASIARPYLTGPNPSVGESVPIERRRFLQAVAFIGAISAYATIILGGTVRGMGAGLACPDWPLCHGSIVPELGDPSIAVEYAHRLAAVLTSFFLLLTLAVVLGWFRPDLRLVLLSVLSFAILVTQVGFGALTITSSLDWVVVTIHLALGTATFAFALMVALVSLRPPGITRRRDPHATAHSFDEEVHEADADKAGDGPEEPSSSAITGGDR